MLATLDLSGSNTDCKLFASCFRYKADGAIKERAVGAQRGFITDRVMVENVVEIESAAMKAFFPQNNKAALILFHFAAAFPYVSRRYMWLVLEAICLPDHVIRAVKALYKNNHHYLSFCGRLIYAFCSAAGVRQGCPASTSLFVMVTDPIMRALCLRLPRGCIARAYADDIAVVLTHIWTQGPAIAALFADVAIFT